MDNLWIIYGYGWWLSPTPLKNMGSSIGMMKFPTEWKNKIHVPVTTNQIMLDNVGSSYRAMGQNQVPLMIPKMNRIVFMGMFTYPFLVIIGIDPPPYIYNWQWQYKQIMDIAGYED